MRTWVFVFLWQGVLLAANAVVPTGYYASIEGQQSAALKSALSSLLQHHVVLEYNSLWSAFAETDIHPDGTPWDMYSSTIRVSFWGMNREHAFPKSWWGGAVNAAYSDLHHIFPADEAANLAKNNYPLGKVGIPVFDNGVSKVGYDSFQESSSENLVFEPADAYKGDFARAYFYVATCYQDLVWKHTFMVESNPYPTLRAEAINLLKDWHLKDPVSEKERIRNDAVFERQGNRNPFVDFPELVSYVWGDSTAFAFSLAGREGGQATERLLQVYVKQGILYFHASKPGLLVEAFNPLGIKQLSVISTADWQHMDSLSAGVYVLVCSGCTWKVVVR